MFSWSSIDKERVVSYRVFKMTGDLEDKFEQEN
jgi:hypothetical protein